MAQTLPSPEEQMRQARERRAQREARLRRHIEMGYEPNGRIRDDGGIVLTTTKGYTPYSTPELVARVRAIMDRFEAAHGERRCPINNRHQLQIRGKHLRRLLKAMPNVRQVGRALVEMPS